MNSNAILPLFTVSLLAAGCVDSSYSSKPPEYPDRLFTVPGIKNAAYVRSRLNEGVDPNLKNRVVYNKDPLLTFAARHGAVETIAVLLDAGADIDIESDQYRTPLFEAVAKGNIGTVKLLLERGADVNATDIHGNNVLNEAIQAKNAEMVRLLLDAGCDPDHQAADGYTMREIARAVGTEEIKKLLPMTDPAAEKTTPGSK